MWRFVRRATYEVIRGIGGFLAILGLLALPPLVVFAFIRRSEEYAEFMLLRAIPADLGVILVGGLLVQVARVIYKKPEHTADTADPQLTRTFQSSLCSGLQRKHGNKQRTPEGARTVAFADRHHRLMTTAEETTVSASRPTNSRTKSVLAVITALLGVVSGAAALGGVFLVFFSSYPHRWSILLGGLIGFTFFAWMVDRATSGLAREEAEGLLALPTLHQAIDTIPTVRPEAPMEALIAALDSPYASVRQAAARALDERGWRPAGEEQVTTYVVAARRWDDLAVADQSEVRIHRLRGYLGDLDAEVRARVAKALRLLGWRPATDLDDMLVAIAERRWRDAVEHGDVAFRALVAAMADDAIRHQTVPVLAESFDEAIVPLIDGLEDMSPDVRRAAAETLIELKDLSVESLIALLKSATAEPELERIVVLLLGRADDPVALESVFARVSQVMSAVQMMKGSDDIRYWNRLLLRAGTLALARLVQADPHRIVTLVAQRWDNRFASDLELTHAVDLACDTLRFLGGDVALTELDSLRDGWKARAKFSPGIESTIDTAMKKTRRDLQEHKPSLLDSYDQVLADALAVRPIPSERARPLPKERAVGFLLALPAGVASYLVFTLVLSLDAFAESDATWIIKTPAGLAAALVPVWAVTIARSLARRRAARARSMRRSLLD